MTMRAAIGFIAWQAWRLLDLFHLADPCGRSGSWLLPTAGDWFYRDEVAR